MRKIWNTLIYGDKRTKIYLWSILVLIAVSVISCVMFLITVSIWWVLGILGGLIGAAIVGTTVKFSVVDEAERSETVKLTERNEERKELRDRRPDDLIKEVYSEKKKKTEAYEEKEEQETPEENEKFLKTLHKKQIKKLMYKYKVKKIHYPILIEHCESHKLNQCPAYVWVNKGKLKVLVLSAKTKAFEIPLFETHTILAERAVKANPKEEYAAVKAAKYIAKVFQELIPSYYIMADENGRRTHRKNSYRLGEDFVVTNGSVRALMELTQARFILPEDEKMSKAYGTYTTEAYKLKFLLQEGIILTEEYKVKIRILLQQMTDADISDAEFDKNLNLMIKKQLITEEYAKYYEDARRGRQ